MDIQAIAQQLVSKAGDSPDLLSSLASDPAAAIKDVTGESLDASQVGAVLEKIGPMLKEAGIDMGNFDLGQIASLASGLLAGDSNGEGGAGDMVSGALNALGGMFGKK